MSINVALAAAIAVGVQALLAYAGPPPPKPPPAKAKAGTVAEAASGGAVGRGSVFCVALFVLRLAWYLSAVARLSYDPAPRPPGPGGEPPAVSVYAVRTRDLAAVLLADLVATAALAALHAVLAGTSETETCAAVSVATWATAVACLGAADFLSRRGGPGEPGVIDARVAYLGVIAAHAAAAPVLAACSGRTGSI